MFGKAEAVLCINTRGVFRGNPTESSFAELTNELITRVISNCASLMETALRPEGLGPGVQRADHQFDPSSRRQAAAVADDSDVCSYGRCTPEAGLAYGPV